MPAEIFGNSHRFLGGDELLSFDEIVRVARVCAELGVEKIKLTGGEPLLRPFLHDLIQRLREIPGIQDVGLITNGFYLRKLAPRLAAAGLNRVSVSLDSLDQEVFTQMAGRHARVEQILGAMDAAADAGLGPIKVNTVVQRGVNDDQVEPFCGACTRLRVTADGTLYTCLFSVRGTDLRAHLRAGATDDDLTDTISSVWKGRRDRYSEDRLHGRAHSGEKVEMNRMGG